MFAAEEFQKVPGRDAVGELPCGISQQSLSSPFVPHMLPRSALKVPSWVRVAAAGENTLEMQFQAGFCSVLLRFGFALSASRSSPTVGGLQTR